MEVVRPCVRQRGAAEVATCAVNLVADDVPLDDEVRVGDAAPVDTGEFDGSQESWNVLGLCVNLTLDPWVWPGRGVGWCGSEEGRADSERGDER